MTAPSVTHRGGSTDSADAALAIPLPATIVKGQRIYAIYCSHSQDGQAKFGALGDLTGWNHAIGERDDSGASPVTTLKYLYKTANGDEDGATLTATTTGNEQRCYETGVISGADPLTPPIVAFTQTAGSASANPDPPSLAAPWGAEDTLWQAVSGGDGNSAYSGAPSGYSASSNRQTGGGANTRAALAYAEKASSTTPEDPSAWTRASDQWIAATVATRPAPLAPLHPTILRQQMFQPTPAADTDVTITIDAASNRRLVVLVCADAGVGVTAKPTAVTLDPAGTPIALALASDGSTTADTNNQYLVQWWTLAGSALPAPGSYTLRVTFAGATPRVINAIMVQGAKTAIALVSNTTVDGSANISVPEENCLVLVGSNFSATNDGPTLAPWNARTIAGHQAMGLGESSYAGANDYFVSTYAKGLTTETGTQAVNFDSNGARNLASTNSRSVLVLGPAPAAGNAPWFGAVA